MGTPSTPSASGKACPMFVVPLPRGEGYANLVWQAGNSDSPFLGGNIFLAIVNLQDSRICGFPTLDFRFFLSFPSSKEVSFLWHLPKSRACRPRRSRLADHHNDPLRHREIEFSSRHWKGSSTWAAHSSTALWISWSNALRDLWCAEGRTPRWLIWASTFLLSCWCQDLSISSRKMRICLKIHQYHPKSNAWPGFIILCQRKFHENCGFYNPFFDDMSGLISWFSCGVRSNPTCSPRRGWSKWIKNNGIYELPSGKHLHNYGKSQFLMGKSTINGNFQ